MGFVSPAGRVRGRRRAAPSAFVVAAVGRMSVERWRDEAESRAGASREHETAQRAPFTKARWRGTRKRPSRSSKHESASPRSRKTTFGHCGETHRYAIIGNVKAKQANGKKRKCQQYALLHRVLGWCVSHTKELLADWDLARRGEEPKWIDWTID